MIGVIGRPGFPVTAGVNARTVDIRISENMIADASHRAGFAGDPPARSGGLRTKVAPWDADRIMAPDIAAARVLLRDLAVTLA